MNKKKHRILIIICIAAILTASGVTIYYHLFSTNFNITETAYVFIDRDDSLDSVYYKVEKAGAPVSIQGFKILALFYDYDKNILTGRYSIYPDDNVFRVFRRILHGRQAPVNLSFNNIRTKERLAKTLGNQLMIDSAEIANSLFDSAFCEKIGYNKENIISMFIPNTYEIYWNINLNDFFKRMQKEHDAFWTKERLNKAKEMGLSPEEVITLASIVEEETNNDTEKPMVAGLYMNRLRRGMPLQADPTIKFGLQDFSIRRINKSHLETDSPYNTYRYKGLPPGPIRIPSIKGIDSVLNYNKHDYIYMCAKDDFSGTHNFATTFSEHQKNAKKYWEALNKRKIFQ